MHSSLHWNAGLVLILAQEYRSNGIDEFVTESKGRLAENKVPLSLYWSRFQKLLRMFRMGLPSSVNLIKKTLMGVPSDYFYLVFNCQRFKFNSLIPPSLLPLQTFPMVLLSLFQIHHLIFFSGYYLYLWRSSSQIQSSSELS